MKKRLISLTVILTVLALAVTGCGVKVVKIGEEDKLTGEKKFNAGDDVANFWDSQAIPEMEGKAMDLSELLKNAKGDFKSQADKGRYSMGTSGELSYVVKGSGKIEEVNTKSQAGKMKLKLDNYDGSEDIEIQIGKVIKGSSVRDSLSFLNFNDYTNQKDWAAVSQSINQIILQKVVNPDNAGDLQGKSIEFVGCFTVDDPKVILITPVEIKTK